MKTILEFLTLLTNRCEDQLAIPIEDIVDSLSDAVWLSGRLALDSRAWELSPELGDKPDDKVESPDTLDSTNPDNDVSTPNDSEPPPLTSPSGEKELFAESEYGAKSIQGTKLSFPCVSPLRGPLEFERALRPFAGRVRNDRHQVFDESSTADRIAATLGSVWSISTKPAMERPWQGLVVVERSPTMRFWHDTVDSFQKLMWRTSAFQRLNSAYVDSFGSTATLHANQSLTSPFAIEELSSETANEWIFFFTDFRSNPWLNGSMIETLRNWKQISNVLVVHMMPQSYWEHSALLQYPRIPLSRLGPSCATSSAGIEIVPIVSFEANSFADWASWVSGKSRTKAIGINLNSVSNAPVESNTKPAPLTAQQVEERSTNIFNRFQSFATEPAQTLARSLAAAPLILPVIRLIQRQLVPKSTNSHLAEVLYSGLVKRVSPAETSTDPNTIEYDFLPGIRDQLLDQSSLQRIHDVWNVNWEYMKSNYGHGIDFNAIMADPSSANDFSVASADDVCTAFVRVSGKILQRFGGGQAKAGTKLLDTIDKNPKEHMPVPDSERPSREYETLKIEFEDGTNLTKGTKFSHPNLKKADTYRPYSSKSSRLWRPMLREAGFEFLDLLERAIVVSCSLHQSVNPSPARRESRNLWRSRIDTVDATVDGLSVEFEKLVSAKGQELESEWTFVNEQGNRICNGAGKPEAYMLGMKRIYFLSGQGSPNSRERANTVSEFREIAKRASQALEMMSRTEAKKLWRNWKHGFPASCVGKEHLWYDALFELGFQKKFMFAFDRFLISIHGDQLGDRVPLIGDGIFPRLPENLSEEIVERIPHQLGYPIDSESLIADVVAASFTAINHLLGEDLQEQRRKEFVLTGETGNFASKDGDAQFEAKRPPVDFRSIEFEDGTNVPKGSSFRESVRQSSRGAWYLPSKQVSFQNWKNDWREILNILRGLRSVDVNLSCTLLQTNVPRVGALAFSSITNNEDKQSIRGCTGLSRDFVALSQIGNEPLLAEYPFLDVNRNPIATINGEAFPYRLGFSRQYFVYEETNLERRVAFELSKKFFEAFESASQKLRDLPKEISDKIWNHWSEGFDSSKFGEDSLWYDALFELALNKSLSLPFRVDRFVGISTEYETTGRIMLTGDELYPRIPVDVSQKAYESIPNQLGYPDYYEASIPDLVSASIDAIQWILSTSPRDAKGKSVLILHGTDSSEHVRRCGELSKQFQKSGYESIEPETAFGLWMSWALDAAARADRILVTLSEEQYRQDTTLRSVRTSPSFTNAISVLNAILDSQNRKKVWVALLSKDDLDWRLDRLLEFPHIMLDESSRNSMVLEGIMEWDSEKINNGLTLIDPKTSLGRGEPNNPTPRHRVFISFSYSDDDYRRELRTILKADDEIRQHFFDDLEIKGGSNWNKELRAAASETRVMIMLVSPRYLDRESCKAWRYEIPSALEAQDRQELTILWVATQPVRISDTPFSYIQASHPPSRPLDSLSYDERFAVYGKIRDEVKHIISTGEGSSEFPIPREFSAPKVFISYSHDSLEHVKQIIAFADQLRQDGIDAVIDQYELNPPEGWPMWLERQVEMADFVLMVCSERYYRLSRGIDVSGLAELATWESVLLSNQLYISQHHNSKLISILLDSSAEKWILSRMQPYSKFTISDFELAREGGYQDLYRVLTSQPVTTGIAGSIRRIPIEPIRPRPKVTAISALDKSPSLAVFNAAKELLRQNLAFRELLVRWTEVNDFEALVNAILEHNDPLEHFCKLVLSKLVVTEGTKLSKEEQEGINAFKDYATMLSLPSKDIDAVSHAFGEEIKRVDAKCNDKRLIYLTIARVLGETNSAVMTPKFLDILSKDEGTKSILERNDRWLIPATIQLPENADGSLDGYFLDEFKRGLAAKFGISSSSANPVGLINDRLKRYQETGNYVAAFLEESYQSEIPKIHDTFSSLIVVTLPKNDDEIYDRVLGFRQEIEARLKIVSNAENH